MKTLARSAITMLLLLGLLSACQLVDFPLQTPTLTSEPGNDVFGQTAPIHMIGVAMRVENPTGAQTEVNAGDTISVQLVFTPSIITQTLKPDGSVFSTNWQPWDNSTVSEMETCFSVEAPCTLTGSWTAYQPSLSFKVPVDWLGEKSLYAAAQFRDASGQIIPTGEAYTPLTGADYQAKLAVVSRMPTTPPTASLPAQVITAQAATQMAFPVTGSVVIENGRCCAGGIEGTEITLQVAFQAESPDAKVTEMRVQTGGGCLRDEGNLNAAWEPFVPSRSYTTTLGLNWVGYYVNVQYRDENGSLSPVYCDDISLEGSPRQ